MDMLLLEAHAEHFPFLKRLISRRKLNALSSFPGVYPEVTTEASRSREITGVPTPYLKHASWEDRRVPGYFPVFGGSATSALLDGQEASIFALSMMQGVPVDSTEWIGRIANRLPSRSAQGMIWDSHRTACSSEAA
jgi:hypothetical protein